MIILWLELKRFYISPDDPERAITVIDRQRVLDLNHAAEQKGIRRGMTARQARALTGDAEHRSYRREDFDSRSRAWLDVCLDYSGIVQPFSQHAAWVDLTSHPHPTDIADRLVHALAALTGQVVETGLANSCWVARLAARHEDWGLALRDPTTFLASLPVADLLPVDQEHQARLRFLGYPTIGSVASLPLPVLRSQFGDMGMLIHSAARSALADPVIPTYPPNHMVERFLFDCPTSQTQDIELAAKHLAERLGNQLQVQDRETVHARFTVETEDGAAHPTLRSFARPMHNAATVHAALRALLKKLPNQPIASLQLLLHDLEIVRAVQTPMFDSGENSTKWSEAPLRHLKDIFGDQSIQRASQIQIPRRVRVLNEWRQATGWR